MSDVDIPVARILDGIEQAHAVGLAPVKVNAVIERGVNDCQILSRASPRTDISTPVSLPRKAPIFELHSHWLTRDDCYSELHADRRRTGTGKSYPTVRMSLVGG